MYCTLTMLADSLGARELAQVATPDRARVIDDVLMDATLRGTDRSAFDADDIAIADIALATISQALIDADQVIDGYLRIRKPVPYTTPLDPVPGIVSVWARQITRYLLHKDRQSEGEGRDPIVRDYNDAKKFLREVADGKFSLGGDDPLPPPAGGSPEVAEADRTFTEESLRDFTRGYGT